MLVVMRSAGVTLQVNLRNPLNPDDKVNKARDPPSRLKPRADVTRSSNH